MNAACVSVHVLLPGWIAHKVAGFAAKNILKFTSNFIRIQLCVHLFSHHCCLNYSPYRKTEWNQSIVTMLIKDLYMEVITYRWLKHLQNNIHQFLLHSVYTQWTAEFLVLSLNNKQIYSGSYISESFWVQATCGPVKPSKCTYSEE